MDEYYKYENGALVVVDGVVVEKPKKRRTFVRKRRDDSDQHLVDLRAQEIAKEYKEQFQTDLDFYREQVSELEVELYNKDIRISSLKEDITTIGKQLTRERENTHRNISHFSSVDPVTEIMSFIKDAYRDGVYNMLDKVDELYFRNQPATAGPWGSDNEDVEVVSDTEIEFMITNYVSSALRDKGLSREVRRKAKRIAESIKADEEETKDEVGGSW